MIHYIFAYLQLRLLNFLHGADAPLPILNVGCQTFAIYLHCQLKCANLMSLHEFGEVIFYKKAQLNSPTAYVIAFKSRIPQQIGIEAFIRQEIVKY